MNGAPTMATNPVEMQPGLPSTLSQFEKRAIRRRSTNKVIIWGSFQGRVFGGRGVSRSYLSQVVWSSWWVSSGVPRYSTAKANICFSLVGVDLVAYIQRMPTDQAVITGLQCRNDAAFGCLGDTP